MAKIRVRWAGVLLGVAIVLAGCNTGPPAPKTYAVKGVVKFKDGKPFTDGSVYFRPASGTGNPAIGEVDSEGRFTLSTFHNNNKLTGAQEGNYQVMVMAKMDQNQAGGWSVNLPTPFTIKPSDDNDFTITIDRPHK